MSSRNRVKKRQARGASTSAHLLAFLRDPKGVSALLPSSAGVVERIASKVGPEGAEAIVEYGPGNGVVTRRLLERLRPEGRMVAIERDAGLAETLRATIDDPRLTVVCDAAENVSAILSDLSMPPANHVFSGIPFFWLSTGAARELVAATHSSLRPGGSFVTYQVFYQPRHRLRDHLDSCFATVRSEVDLRNLPPYRISEAVK